MATETATATTQPTVDAVQEQDTGTAGTIHLPLDHKRATAETITATVAPPSTGDGGLPHETLREMYRLIYLARALDERMWQLNRAGSAPFAVSGQAHEAAQVGAAFALDRERDILLPYYRDLAFCLAFGVTAYEIMLSVLAKEGEPSSGARQMPGHYGSAKHRIITGSSPVATQVPHATGTAYAAKMLGTGQVSITCFGEGGASKGDVHEACNFAGIHKLPVIFFCENNHYAISVPQTQQMALPHVADRAAGYGFPGIVVDGTDPIAVYGVVKGAADRARSGDGPTLVEAKVYRFNPHTSDDDDRAYRSQEEIQTWRAHDPVALFESRLREVGALDESSAAELKADVKREVNQATEDAERAAFPDPATFARYVYAES